MSDKGKRRMKPKKDKYSTLDMMSDSRKPLPKPTRAHNPKNNYNRRDKSWMNSDDNDED